MMEIEKKQTFIINFWYGLIITGILLFLIKYIVPLIAPFIFGFLIAFFLKKPISFLTERCGGNRLFLAVVFVILFYGTVIILFSLTGMRLFVSIKDLFFDLPNLYRGEIQPSLIKVFHFIEKSMSQMDASLISAMDELSGQILQSVGDFISRLSVKAIKAVSDCVTALPATLIKILFMIISTFFFTMDYQKVIGFLLRQMKKSHRKLAIEIKNYVVHTLLKCLASYLLIMAITFIELFVGFSIIRISNAFSIALLIAIFDLLPVLGTGTILIPWTIFLSVQGNYPQAFGILSIYLFITVVRNIIEPKIVGEQMGLPPLVTLMSMFIGAQLFGILGMVSFPITVSLLKNLNEKGTIHIWK